MLRILIAAMNEVEGKYWYQGQLFSGIGFFPRGDHIQGRWINVGLLEGVYSPIILEVGSVFPQLNLTGPLSDYDLISYEDQPFNGVGYEFSDEFCVHEAFVLDGAIHSEAYWNAEGLMLHLSLDNGEFGEIYEWHPNGERKSIDVSTNSSFSGHFAYTQEGALRYLNGNRGFLSAFGGIHKKAKFFPYDSYESAFKANCGRNMILSGSDVNDEKFISIVSFLGFKTVERLELRDTDVANPDLDLPHNLREIYIYDGRPDRKDLPKVIKSKNSEVRVFFNDEEFFG